MHGHTVRDPAHSPESKQSQADEPANVIADYWDSQLMNIGSRVDIGAGGRRRARRAEPVDLKPDGGSGNTSQSLDQGPPLHRVSEDAVRNRKSVDYGNAGPTVPVQVGS